MNKSIAIKNYNNLLAHEKKYVKQNEYIVYFIIALFLVLIVLKFLIYAFIKQKKYLATINNQKLELSRQNMNLSKLNARINFELEKSERVNNTLSHDIKSGIISIKEIAKRIKTKSIEPLITDESAKIVNETDSLADTINFVLDSAKSDNSSSFEIETIDWEAVLEQSKNSLEHLLSFIQPTIILNLDGSSFLGYKTHFYQLFKNLIENSLKYSDPSRACCITIKITKKDKNKLIIKYEDNGIGIEKENLSKIFDFFNQSKFEHISKGYGLGLGICKKIVDSYKGNISVTSIPGQGTKFSIIMYEFLE